MAKVSFGPLISEARNKTGNVVFSRNHAGPFARARVNPSQTVTTARTESHAALTALSTAWNSTLTQDQRDAWAQFATTLTPRPGPVYPKRAHGRANFFRFNKALQQYFAPHFDPPTDTSCQDSGALTGLSLDSDTPLFLIDVENRPDINHALMVYASAPQHPGRSSAKLTYYAMAQLTIADYFPADIYPQYSAFVTAWNARQAGRHDPVAPGDRVFLKCHMLNLNSGATAQDWYGRTDNAGTGEDAMLHTRVTLTDAQIKALPTTPFQLLPGIAGKSYVLHTIALALHLPSGPYTNVSAGTNDLFNAEYGTDDASTYLDNTGFFDAGQDELVRLDTTGYINAPSTSIQGSAQSAPLDNQALMLYVNNTLGNFTGGGSGNTLVVDIFYSTIDQP